MKIYRVCLHSTYSVVEHQYESHDGHGYHKVLTREKFSIANKILSLADIYSALMSDKPYRSSCDRALLSSNIQNQTPRWLEAELIKNLIEIKKFENSQYVI